MNKVKRHHSVALSSTAPRNRRCALSVCVCVCVCLALGGLCGSALEWHSVAMCMCVCVCVCVRVCVCVCVCVCVTLCQGHCLDSATPGHIKMWKETYKPHVEKWKEIYRYEQVKGSHSVAQCHTVPLKGTATQSTQCHIHPPPPHHTNTVPNCDTQGHCPRVRALFSHDTVGTVSVFLSWHRTHDTVGTVCFLTTQYPQDHEGYHLWALSSTEALCHCPQQATVPLSGNSALKWHSATVSWEILPMNECNIIIKSVISSEVFHWNTIICGTEGLS